MMKSVAALAALAMSVSLAPADPAFAQGKSGEKGNNGGAQGENQAGKAERGNGNNKKGPDNKGPDRKQVAKQDRGNGNAAKAMRPADRGPKQANGNAGGAAKPDRVYDRRDDRSVRNVRNDRNDRDFRDWNYERDARDWYDVRRRYAGPVDGCPPGLAKKRNGCLPPGQAKKLYNRYDRYGPSFFGLRGIRDGRYFYNDGYLLRYGAGDMISGFIPLLGGALSIGNSWPRGYYSNGPLPSYYESYYGLGGPNSYRYADDVIYRVDPETAAITSIAALLTGDEFVVGQPMPTGYDVYNVPYGYRDRYYDTPRYNYRYADGYIYQVDPQTRLIAAAIELLI